MLHVLVRRLVFPRHLTGRRLDPQPNDVFERHWLDTRQGPVEYWFVPARLAAGHGRRPVVLFAHGNAELIDDWVEPLSRYGALGVHLVLVEYRGYGRSHGSPTQKRLVHDFVRIVEQVCERDDVDPSFVLYHGRSLGGGVACAAAVQRPPSALILQSTFTSLTDMGRRFGAPRWAMPDAFDNLSALRTMPCPVLLMHGDADALVPIDHAHALAAAGHLSRLKVFAGADHNAPLDQSPAYWEEIASLLNALHG